MSSPRPWILLCVLLILALGYQMRGYLMAPFSRPYPVAVQVIEPPLPGKNSISGLRVHAGPGHTWLADFDCFFTGGIARYPELLIEVLPQSATVRPGDPHVNMIASAKRGAQHLSAVVPYGGVEETTRQVRVTMRVGREPALASQTIDQLIDWPSFGTWVRDEQLAENSPADNLKQAVALIDDGSPQKLSEAKAILERLLQQDSHLDGAYVELARVAGKTNPSPEGLHQAENLLASALQLRPDSANAKILLGYVYAHQRRFEKAQALFVEVAPSDPPNLWLWVNWGELLAMQGKPAQAMEKYRVAIAHPMHHDTYDRARLDAYRQMLAVLEKRHDLDGMEALYQQRIAEYGPGACYSSAYARFMLTVRGNTQGAIDLARRALNQNCEDSEARRILGLAEYVKWAGSSGPQREESLNEARVFLPAGPMAIYLLAGNERTADAARKLIAAGEPLEQRDSENMTALAYAVQEGNQGATRRLLAFGAHADATVAGGIPLALLPVMKGDLELVRILRQHGIDYAHLRWQGATAFDFAKQSGNEALLEALGQHGTAL